MENTTKNKSAWPASRSKRDGQRGFALLLVFAMAAAVAITLYMQMPRVAFEAQRDREEMLIQRGEEYKRAIELYVRKNNRYPQRLEDLERQQDVRYLRRRYKDPLTGDDEWRLIHINAAGQLEDSLVKKKKVEGETAEAPGEEEISDENVAENSALARQRSGDQLAASAAFPGSGNEAARPIADGQQPPPPVNPLDEGLVPLLDASGNVIDRTKTEAEAQAQQQGGSVGEAGPAGNPSAPGQSPSAVGITQQTRLGPGGIPIIEDPSAAVAQSQNPQAASTPGGPPIAGIPGRAPGGQSGQQGPQQGGQQSAQQLLQGLLTRPVPGGLQGIQQRRGIQPAGAGASQGLGAGIAGVASKFEMRGIKVYDEQESIHKWEFVFDARAASTPSAAQGARSPQGQQGAGNGFGFGGTGSGSGRTGGQRRPGGQGPSVNPTGPSFGMQPIGGVGSQPRRPR